MITDLVPSAVKQHFLAACHAELNALKPGNVHVFAAGHDMDVAHFTDAAAAAAPFMSDPDLQVGERIECAVRASFDAAQCNTNLGIILLTGPLAQAALTPVAIDKHKPPPSLRVRLAAVLANLTSEDTAAVFRAIAYAKPGGLGDASNSDVRKPPSTSLIAAMTQAADKDRIARSYVTDYADIFDLGLPALRRAEEDCSAAGIDSNLAVTTLHMTFLAAFPDSHIARKYGIDTAKAVAAEAAKNRPLWQPTARPDTASDLLDFDTRLKDQNLNPGTTADLVVATLFADRLDMALTVEETAS